MGKDNRDNTIEISFRKGLAILIGAIITSATATIFVALRVANADHFSIMALNSRVQAIEEDYVSGSQISSEFEGIREVMTTGFDHVENRFDRIEEKVDRHLESH